MIGGAVGEQRRPHLTIGEPGSGDGCTGPDEFLAHDEAIDRWAGRAAVGVVGPGHADPTAARQFLGELLRIAVDPRIVLTTEAGDRVGCDSGGLGAECELFGSPREVHHGRC